MRLNFLGAARMVTGSCFLLEAGGLRILIDCGMFQGGDEELNETAFTFNPAGLDAVILTHAHIDHSGRLPLLVKQGFRGRIYTHPATADLAVIMLLDSAHIQEADAERANRKAGRAGHKAKPPLYTLADARMVQGLFHTISYGKLERLSDRLSIRLQDAGHILGSAIVEIFETDGQGNTTKLVFTGDIGQPGRPILGDPTLIDEADYLVMESTYGNRLHDAPTDKRDALAAIIRDTIARGGNVVIPSFAVGRTQELLYELNGLAEAGKLPKGLKVVVDSPLAIAATEITAKHQEVYDEEARGILSRGSSPLTFRGLATSSTAEDSKALNEDRSPKVIIAASGMCEAGRIRHHLKNNIGDAKNTILLPGYQAANTLGRKLADGAREVQIFHETYPMRAEVVQIHGFSGHADQADLLRMLTPLAGSARRVFLVHGEPDQSAALVARLREAGMNQTEIAATGARVTI